MTPVDIRDSYQINCNHHHDSTQVADQPMGTVELNKLLNILQERSISFKDMAQPSSVNSLLGTLVVLLKPLASFGQWTARETSTHQKLPMGANP